jgi:hypothetical protein
VNVLLICSAGVAAVLLLFAFLFVGRQGNTVKIMVSLGTPERKTTLWFASGALVICGAAAGIGMLLASVLRPAIFHMISETAAAAREGGFLRYSQTALGIAKETVFDPQIPLWPGLLAAFGIIISALLFCLLFLRLARRGGTRKRGKSRVHVPHGRTSVQGRGGLRFALLSIRRNGWRSLAVVLVSLMLTVTVLFLGGMYQGWQNTLNVFRDVLFGLCGLPEIAPDLSPMAELVLCSRAGKTVAQLINASGCFANNYFAPVPLREIRLKLPGLTGKEKPVTLRGGKAEVRETDGCFAVVLDQLKDYEAIILE